jgi:hypothetical protein
VAPLRPTVTRILPTATVLPLPGLAVDFLPVLGRRKGAASQGERREVEAATADVELHGIARDSVRAIRGEDSSAA